MQSRALRISLYSVLGFFGLLVLLVATIVLMPTTWLTHIAGSKVSAKVGRSFSIDGPIEIDWDWTTPNVHLSDIHLANAPQGAGQSPDMVDIKSLDFHIQIWKLLEGQLNLPDIHFNNPVIILEKYDDNNNNWDFPALSKANTAVKAALPSKRGNFPIIGELDIQNGKLIYRDKPKNLDLTLNISTANGGAGEKSMFQISGEGNLQNKPFDLKARGGSLEMLRDSHEKYPLDMHVKMGATSVDVSGTFLDPVKMQGVDAKLDLSGDDLADLYYLTTIPLPPSPPYSLSGHLVKTGDIWKFEDFKGKVGNSDLEGHLSDDVSTRRGFVQADLTSNLLDMKDLGGFVGATPTPQAGERASPAQVEKAAKEKASSKLLPDVPIDLSRLRSKDMDVTLKAEKVLAPGLPMNDLDIRFDLKDGVVKLDPFDFGIANGQISGSLVLDGRESIPEVETNLLVSRLSLKQFFKDSRFAPLTSGYIGGRFVVTGRGKSLAEVLGDSNGRVTFLMSGGQVSELIVDAAGLDIGNAATDLLGKDKSTNIRCAVGDFGVSNGLLNSNVFVVDTGISNIAGEAHINLKDETIDARITAEPKETTVTAHAPIVITGPLKHPSIGIDAKEAVGRGVAAGVLSVFLTPLAAVIPFIEAGLGKDSDCKSLISQAQAHAKVPANVAPAKVTP